MALHDLSVALQDSALGQTIGGSAWLFPTLETIHLFCLTTVLGSIAIVDLRLLGLAGGGEPASVVLRRYTPFTWWAFLGAAISGGLLFVSRAGAYTDLPVFYMKLGYMALAALNMAYFHFFIEPTVAAWDRGPPATAARIAGGLSLLFWASVVVCARQVGFHM
ncbi:MAG TPA: hypothetical protein VL460_01555 [Caulobacteraceae bacterium]|jgi:hypothetical protein|nr:hypothetical protein [Caulobacteraceae bacterium]